MFKTSLALLVTCNYKVYISERKYQSICFMYNEKMKKSWVNLFFKLAHNCLWFMNLLIRLAPETVPAIRSKLADPLHQKRTWSYSGRWNGLGKNLSGIYYNNHIKIDIRIAKRWINVIGHAGKWSFVYDLLDQGASESAFQLYLYSLYIYIYPTPLLLIVLDNIEIRGMGLYIVSNDQLPILMYCLWNWHMT